MGTQNGKTADQQAPNDPFPRGEERTFGSDEPISWIGTMLRPGDYFVARLGKRFHSDKFKGDGWARLFHSVYIFRGNDHKPMAFHVLGGLSESKILADLFQASDEKKLVRVTRGQNIPTASGEAHGYTASVFERDADVTKVTTLIDRARARLQQDGTLKVDSLEGGNDDLPF